MSTDYAELTQSLGSKVREQFANFKIAGASIALIDDRDVVWSQGSGFADKESNIPASPQTIYKIGSITKVFTTTAVMQLSERSKLNIDYPVKVYIPEFSAKSRFGDAPAHDPEREAQTAPMKE